jgi:hypothetical protein
MALTFRQATLKARQLRIVAFVAFILKFMFDFMYGSSDDSKVSVYLEDFRPMRSQAIGTLLK